MLFPCVGDDDVKRIAHRAEQPCRVHDAQLMRIALVAALAFSGNVAAATRCMPEQGQVGYGLRRRRCSRRVPRINAHGLTVFAHLAQGWKELNAQAIYGLDTFAIVVCDTQRIARCRLYQDEHQRGYQARKQRSFYGLKLHRMVPQQGYPVQFFLTPGATSDVTGLLDFDFDLPPDALVVADKADTDDEIEAVLDTVGIHLRPIRK